MTGQSRRRFLGAAAAAVGAASFPAVITRRAEAAGPAVPKEFKIGWQKGAAILVPKDSPIKAVADLKGKRVAVAKGSSSHAVTVRALAHAGLSPRDIQEVYLAPADATAAFNGGRVDAWTVWDPYYAIAEQRYNARVLIDTKAPHLASYSYWLANRAFAGRAGRAHPH